MIHLFLRKDTKTGFYGTFRRCTLNIHLRTSQGKWREVIKIDHENTSIHLNLLLHICQTSS